MRLQVKAQHGHLPSSTRAYAEKRFSKLDKRLHDLTLVEVTFSQEHNPSIADDHAAEAIVYTKGSSIVARESATSFEAAVDQLVDKLERQVKRYREKRREAPRRHAPPPAEAPPVDLEDTSTEITKTKQFAVNPMTPDEAVLQLELVGHDFFVFQNADTNSVNVVYRRRNGGYGLIEPQL